MKKTISLTLLWTLLALLGTGAVMARDEAEESFEKTVSVASSGQVSLTNTNGSIHVEAWDRDEVAISAVKKARGGDQADAQRILGDIEIKISENGGDVAIETELPRMSGFFKKGSASVKYAIKVPRGVSLLLESTNGKIGVEGVGGTVEVSTTNGGITAEDLGGVLIAETTNGRVEALGVVGPVDAETTNGSINVEMTGTSLDEDMEFSTTNGSVELSLASSVGARIDALSRNGSVKSDLSVRGGTEKRNALSGDLNGGGKMIRIRTSNGSIRIHEN